VPGHERFVRTMVAGATGIDLFLMVVAADDGVMPQTREHAAVLRALGVRAASSRSRRPTSPTRRRRWRRRRELLPGASVRARRARARARRAAARSTRSRPAALARRARRRRVLHVDRSFTIRGAGTVVTGTLWSGAIGAATSCSCCPRARARVCAGPGPRRAASSARGRPARRASTCATPTPVRGDVARPPSRLEPTHILDVALDAASSTARASTSTTARARARAASPGSAATSTSCAARAR
jgi:selenocysteine-specific elongation factor